MRPMGLMRLMRLMRPMRLIGLMGLMGLISACSSEQEPPEEPKPEVKETAIAFSGNMTEEEVTRSTTPLESITNTFKVWGYKNDGYENDEYTSYQQVISEYVVNWVENTAGTTTTNSHDWEYVGQGDDQTIKYWDFSALAYRFFGYALGKGTAGPPAIEPATVKALGGKPIDVPDATQVTFTANIDGSTDATLDAAPYFSELWFSTGALPTYSDKQFGKAVQLRFFKPFAKVRFIFISSDDITITNSDLSDISFHPTDNSNIPTKGNITAIYPLTGTETKVSWLTSVKGGVKDLTVPDVWHNVLPALNQGPYTMEVSVAGKQVQTAVVPASYMIWKPGFEYTYLFKITKAGEVTFDVVQVAISNWNESDPVDRSVHNW